MGDEPHSGSGGEQGAEGRWIVSEERGGGGRGGAGGLRCVDGGEPGGYSGLVSGCAGDRGASAGRAGSRVVGEA